MPKLKQRCVNLLMAYSTLTFTRLLGRFLFTVNVNCSYLHIVCSIHFFPTVNTFYYQCHRELLVCMTFFKNVLFTWPLWVSLFFYSECHTSYRWIYFVLKLYKYFYVLLLHWDFELQRQYYFVKKHFVFVYTDWILQMMLTKLYLLLILLF